MILKQKVFILNFKITTTYDPKINNYQTFSSNIRPLNPRLNNVGTRTRSQSNWAGA